MKKSELKQLIRSVISEVYPGAQAAPEAGLGQKIQKLADEHFKMYGGHPQGKTDFSAGFLHGYRSAKSGE